jgi:alginate O-acetyltransferase complex protein AlgI
MSRSSRRIWILLGLSLGFYATWSVPHTALLVGTVGFVYASALLIERSRSEGRKLQFTVLAVCLLLLMLTAFKCAQWLMEQFYRASAQNLDVTAAWILAPLGLSFFLFKLIGYLLDVYWERLPAQRNFAALTLYAAFFPQIVSGPIQRADDFFAQLRAIQTSDPDAFLVGLRRILFGLFKKVVIADQLAILVAHVHAAPQSHSSAELMIGAYGFSLQMYADFSGLTDIAIGIGLLFGIKGPENFNLPYLSRNIQEFWRRWHMSLTSWLTDYLFLPLRMALRRWGDWGLGFAILINMVAVGVWHGPRWTYLVFGCINGIFLIVSVFTLKSRNAYFKRHPRLAKIRQVAGPLTTFHLMVFTHIFFQASSLTAALAYIDRIATFNSGSVSSAMRVDWYSFGLHPMRLSLAVAGLMIMEWINWAVARPLLSQRFLEAPKMLRWGVYYAVVGLVILSMKGKTSFIYAQF